MRPILPQFASVRRTADVVVVGAGIVGASCALFLARAGLSVIVLDRGSVAAGTTGAGEGNILVSDKEPGAELDLALRSLELWPDLAAELGPETFELESKGGLVVAASAAAFDALQTFADKQRAHGVDSSIVPPEELPRLEPELSRDLAGGAFYPADCQVQPMLAAARMLEAATARGAVLQLGAEVLALRREDVAVTGVVTSAGVVHCRWVVNAAGPWAGEVSQRMGAPIPVLPRRGFVLVTEPLPRLIRRKVYSTDYVANVASDSSGVETSSVIESTPAGTVLIGASRERVGFDRRISLPVVRDLARRAVTLFPMLADVNAIRVYRGFRPYCPDHLPVIGPDPRVIGLLHACGHEGAGIGLAPATGELIADLVAGRAPRLNPAPFRPDRLLAAAGQAEAGGGERKGR